MSQGKKRCVETASICKCLHCQHLTTCTEDGMGSQPVLVPYCALAQEPIFNLMLADAMFSSPRVELADDLEGLPF
jgi:hypothetical protein